MKKNVIFFLLMSKLIFSYDDNETIQNKLLGNYIGYNAKEKLIISNLDKSTKSYKVEWEYIKNPYFWTENTENIEKVLFEATLIKAILDIKGTRKNGRHYKPNEYQFEINKIIFSTDTDFNKNKFYYFSDKNIDNTFYFNSENRKEGNSW